VASAHGAALDEINVLVHWLMLVLFVGWSAFFLYLVVRFRRGRNPHAVYGGIQTKAPKWLEGGVAVVEAILLLAFSIPLWSERVDAFPAESESTVVRVVGEQFAWNVHYSGPDGVFGATRPELVDTETNPLGLDGDDPAAADDVTTINNLYLPVDKPAIVRLSSKDVIHSFMLNEMRVKQDAIPGVSIPVHFEPTVTTAEMRARRGDDAVNYEIACAQLCGLGHFRMRGFLHIVTQDEFDAWIAEQVAAKQETGGDEFWN
jgi:cytochrome c oxidase subunit 2